jgi:hypothetical protein
VSRLLLALAVTALLALVGAFVPVGGRTVMERWRSASSATAFAEAGARELSQAWDRLWSERAEPRKATGSASSRTPGPRTAKGAPPARKAPAEAPAQVPAENHTDEDRSALDRIVAEHATDRRPRH